MVMVGTTTTARRSPDFMSVGGPIASMHVVHVCCQSVVCAHKHRMSVMALVSLSVVGGWRMVTVVPGLEVWRDADGAAQAINSLRIKLRQHKSMLWEPCRGL